jgi:phenylacetate-CoA ligase
VASSRIGSDERSALQWQKLVALVRHAWAHCNYYRQAWGNAGFEPGDLKGWPDLARLPVLSKSDVATHVEDLIADNSNRAILIPRKTSGSTGVSLHFFSDDAEFQFKRAVAIYRDQWAGWRLGEWKACVWGNPTYLHSMRTRLRNTLLERVFSLDTLRMNEGMMREFAEMILQRRPTLLFGHAHSLYLFAQYWQASGYPAYQFAGIISTAMILHRHERTLIEGVFDSRVFNRYGCEEVSLIASECEAHEGLHLNTDSLIVEFVENPMHVEYVERPVIVTDLCNKAMPFIRYKVGDMAVPMETTCPCGRTYPLIREVTGRIADYLRTPEGDWVSGISLTENFATLIRGLDQIQIVQDAHDHLTLRIVRGDDFDAGSLSSAATLVGDRFGPHMRHSIVFVDFISPEQSGKYRFAIYQPGNEQKNPA